MQHSRKRQKLTVTKLSEYKNRDTLATLQQLTRMAMSGEIEGLLFCVRLGARSLAMGSSGSFHADPDAAAQATARMHHRINLRIDQQELMGPMPEAFHH